MTESRRLLRHFSDEQFLQGPLADAMTHAGQLAMPPQPPGPPQKGSGGDS